MSSLVEPVARARSLYPDRPALVVQAESLTYGELWERAGALAAALDPLIAEDSPWVGVLGGGTSATFCGILGALRAGAGYVPLNPSFPAARTAAMILAADSRLLVVDGVGCSLLDEILPLLGAAPRSLVLPELDSGDISVWRTRHPAHRFLGREDLRREEFGSRAPRGDYAYLMFTSGSTGEPKGVAVTHANITHFVETARGLYGFVPEDRFSQMFELSFDLSLFDMFVCWASGGSLHVVPASDRVAPARFLREHALTVWFSVPAVAGFMHQLKVLKAGIFPSLRLSLFCGEALPVRVAEAWQEAAPHATLENLYGPTEATVACTRYRWDPATSPGRAHQGVVPIGTPLAGTRVTVVDGDLRPIGGGEVGELLLAGRQVVPGYWRNAELSASRFVPLTGDAGPWYRTGDLVRRDTHGDLVFLGRVDHQVKILGHRVELGEIEGCLRAAAATEFAIALPWPASSPAGVVACLAGSEALDEEILAECRATLPSYMVPKRIVRVARMPQNSNGKIDRNQLRQWIEGGER